VLYGDPGNDGTVADNVMDTGSGTDIFYGGDGDDMLSPAKDRQLRIPEVHRTPELGFRALLAENGDRRVQLHRA
jgi:hypothetical protein